MKRAIFIVAALILSVAVMAQREKPFNSMLAFVDTIYIQGTADSMSAVYWQSDGAEKALLVELDDTNSTGFASDSANIDIELYQVFNRLDSRGQVISLASRAHPDSTSWPYGSDFIMADSIHIADADTTAAKALAPIPILNANGDTTSYRWTNDISSTETAAGEKGAYFYYPLIPDFSPGIAFKVTGEDLNAKATSTRVILSIYQARGVSTKPNN